MILVLVISMMKREIEFLNIERLKRVKLNKKKKIAINHKKNIEE
jgi:hypothetical protein